MRYRCDYGHEWIIQQRTDKEDHASVVMCPEGHPAVTCREEPPVDDVQLLISPAARIVDPVRSQRILDNRYFLGLLDKMGNELCLSQKNYDWEEVVKLAFFFKGKAVDQALSWWKKRGL